MTTPLPLNESHAVTESAGHVQAHNDLAHYINTYNTALSALSNVNNTSDLAKPVSTATLAMFQKTDCVIIYSGTQPLRTTGTTDTSRRVRWVSPNTPSQATGYAIPGLDIWERTP